jgi:hypothetical protein
MLVLTLPVCLADLPARGEDPSLGEIRRLPTEIPPTGRREIRKPAAEIRPIRSDDLREVLLDSHPVPITKPRNYVPKPPRPLMPAPGSPIVNRRVRIAYRPDAGWYLLTLLPERGVKTRLLTMPRWVLPCKWLAAVERDLFGRSSAIFRVSGETTVYKDRAFVLLRNVKVERSRKSRPKSPDTQPSPASRPSSAPAAQTRPTTRYAPSTPEVKSSADDILTKMLRRTPGEAIEVTDESEDIETAPSVAPGGEREQLDEDRGDMRVDRLVTIMQDGKGEWWEARFESDNTLQDQPVRLLPCKKLQQAEKILSRAKDRIPRLRISGQISHYKQHRYLLLRKVIPEREMGQF